MGGREGGLAQLPGDRWRPGELDRSGLSRATKPRLYKGDGDLSAACRSGAIMASVTLATRVLHSGAHRGPRAGRDERLRPPAPPLNCRAVRRYIDRIAPVDASVRRIVDLPGRQLYAQRLGRAVAGEEVCDGGDAAANEDVGDGGDHGSHDDAVYAVRSLPVRVSKDQAAVPAMRRRASTRLMRSVAICWVCGEVRISSSVRRSARARRVRRIPSVLPSFACRRMARW
jgi:hypothetical protein